MQIDLLGTPGGEVGLMGNSAFDSPVSGVIFDVAERSLTLEFGKSMDTLRMNVPVAEDFVDWLKGASTIFVGAVERERMTQAFQVPLMKVSLSEDDEFFYTPTKRGVGYIQQWLAQARHAQPVHRDNLGDESTSRGVLYNVAPLSALKVAPQLAQELAQKQAMERQSAPRHAPTMSPPSLGPGSNLQNLNINRIPKPPTGMSDEGQE